METSLVESNILLLDISNDSEYIWTDNFIPSITTTSTTSIISTTLSPSTTLASSTNYSTNKSDIIGTAIGSLIGGFLLAVMCFLLYKWNKHKQKQTNTIPTPGNVEGNNYNYENLVIPTRRNIYNQGQEKIPSNLSQINRKEILPIPENENRSNHEPVGNNVYNLGQEAIPIANNNEKLSLQNIDDGLLQHLKNEMLQTLRQEIIQNLGQQNNGQASNSNIT